MLWRSSVRGCSRAGLELFIAAATCCNVGLCVRGKGKEAAQRSFLAARTEAGGGGGCCWRGMTASLIGGTTMGIRMPVEHIHMHTWIHSQASVSASGTEGSSIDGPAPPTTNDQVIMGSVTNQLASHTLKELILPLLR